jgi:GT2 family glycosyltransferase
MISVITATRNRHHELRRMLESLQMVTPPSCEWEVVVVDNNSADGTAAVLRDVERDGRLPLRRLFEERIGKTLACNQAIRASRGELLFFTDDDTIVDRDWLVNMERAGARWPDVVYFGGRVIAVESGPRPAWFTGERPLRSCTGGVLAFDLGDHPFELLPGVAPAPVGANLACRRATFARHGLFREDLGPGPLKYHGDDTELFYRLWHADERTMYVPDAVVHHPVDPSRLHRRYAIRWSYHVGRTSARMRARPPGARVASRVPMYLFRMLASDVLALARAGVSGSPVERQRRLQAAAARLGTIREMIELPLNFDPTRHVPALDVPAPAIRGGRAQG